MLTIDKTLDIDNYDIIFEQEDTCQLTEGCRMRNDARHSLAPFLYKKSLTRPSGHDVPIRQPIGHLTFSLTSPA